MSNYFEFISRELLSKLGQVKEFIKRHNPTIGILTEEILRSFLREHLPKAVSVEQGFIRTKNGQTSKQCDIIIYDATLYAPFYRINDIVVVPEESVLAVIEVKTTINKRIFHDTLDYFRELISVCRIKTYLFIYNSEDINKIASYFYSYTPKIGKKEYDHDTYQLLPDEITGINSSYHLKQDYVIGDRDALGYSSFFYKDEEGTEINAIQHFYMSIYECVEEHLPSLRRGDRSEYFKKDFNKYSAFELFDM